MPRRGSFFSELWKTVSYGNFYRRIKDKKWFPKDSKVTERGVDSPLFLEISDYGQFFQLVLSLGSGMVEAEAPKYQLEDILNKQKALPQILDLHGVRWLADDICSLYVLFC